MSTRCNAARAALRVLLFSSVLLSLAGHIAQAAPPPESLGASVVTATRTATELDEVLAPVILITREDLERSLAPDLATLLQFHAGIDIARNGGPGQVTSVFIRGSDSNHATVLIDGVRINPGTIGGAQLQNIVPESVERIEIVKGPRSTLYGTDAIGGVINVITRRHTGNQAAASLGYGRYDTRHATFSAGYGGARGDWALSAARLDTDGFPTRTTTDQDRGYRNDSFSARARTHVGPLELGVRGWQASGTTQYADFFLAPVDQDYENRVLATEAALRPTAGWLSRLTLSRIEDDIRQNQSQDRVRTRRNALDWQNDLQLGERNVLTLGALLTREDTEALEFGSGFDADTDVDMAFVQHRLDYGRHNLLLALATLDHSTFGNETTWNADYGIDIGSATRVIASVGTAFRAPDSTDRFGFGGNADLDPERSRNHELSLQHQPAPGHRVSLSLFRNDIDDLIQFVVLDPATFDGENRNVEQARVEGAELSYEYRGEQWRLRTEAIVQNPRNLTQDSQLLRRARESFTLSAVRRLGAFEAGMDLLLAGPREDFGFPAPARLDSYTLVDLTARWFVTEGLTLQARLQNALDEQYELARGFNTTDRSLFVSARYSWR